VIPIDLGRQLFVDDFPVEETTLERRYHLAQKHASNPIMEPETDMELNGGYRPVAAPFSDGVFYDGRDGLYKIWYHAGWFDGTGYATSADGFHWERPLLDVVEGTNCVIPARTDQIWDGVSVWIDHGTTNPNERYKMSLYARVRDEARAPDHHAWSAVLGRYDTASIRACGLPTGGRIYTSADGVHWIERGQSGPQGDNTTFFHNPFRRKWVWSIRSSRRNRTRDYYESPGFVEGAAWSRTDPVFWCGADKFDLPDPVVGDTAQLYKIDAVAYESILLGLLQIHRGPHNRVCLAGRYPKITELTVAYSRDGFHWHRPDRRAFVAATRNPGDWDRGYVHSAGGVCVVVGDTIRFYYGGWSGVSPRLGSDLYAGGATGVAILRRDGFASMEAGARGGELTTRQTTFSGRYLFVNADAREGELRVEILDQGGRVIEPFSAGACLPVRSDATRTQVRWKGAEDLSALRSRPIRFHFLLTAGRLYSFWVSGDRSGASHGYLGAGSPGHAGPVDLEGGAGEGQR
jgi:hypothetical protein